MKKLIASTLALGCLALALGCNDTKGKTDGAAKASTDQSGPSKSGLPTPPPLPPPPGK